MRKRPKYKNEKVIVDGIKFDSKKEAKRYGELKLMEGAGVICDLKLQPRFTLMFGDKPLQYVDTGRDITYTADFQYFDQERDKLVIEDTKGYATRDYRIRRAVMAAMGKHVTEI